MTSPRLTAVAAGAPCAPRHTKTVCGRVLPAASCFGRVWWPSSCPVATVEHVETSSQARPARTVWNFAQQCARWVCPLPSLAGAGFLARRTPNHSIVTISSLFSAPACLWLTESSYYSLHRVYWWAKRVSGQHGLQNSPSLAGQPLLEPAARALHSSRVGVAQAPRRVPLCTRRQWCADGSVQRGCGCPCSQGTAH